VRRSKCISSDNGTQFASKIWKNKLADVKIDVMFSSAIMSVTRKPTQRKEA
jgi:hypothetical protein